MTTPSYKHISGAICALNCVVTEEEEIGPMEIVVLEGGNISVSNTDTRKPSPHLILSDKHELSNIYGRNILKRNTNDNTRGSDGTYHATLQNGPEMIVDSTPGEWTHVTRHEGSFVASPFLTSNKIQDGTPRGNYNETQYHR